MLDYVVGQRVDAPGVERGHRELQTDGEDRVGEHDEDEVGVHAQQREAKGSEERDEGAGHDDLAHAKAIEEPSAHETHESADHGAGQHRNTRHRGRVAADALNVERRDDTRAHEGCLHDDDDDDGRRVLARLEDVDLEHRDGQLELTTHEEAHEHEADDDEDAGYEQVVA